MDNSTMINRRKYPEPFNGKLLKEHDGMLVEIEFSYGIRQGRKFTLTQAAIGMEYSQPTEIIYTSQVHLPFADNDRLKLQDGRTMTVNEIQNEFDDQRRAMFGDATPDRFLITLLGGGGA